MGPKIHFIGTGTAELRGEYNEGGFLLKTEKTNLLVDPGPGSAQGLGKQKVDAILITNEERGHDASLIKADIVHADTTLNTISIVKQPGGYLFKLPDGVLTYITDHVDLREIKQYACDVLLIHTHEQDEQIITKLKPRLVILTGYTEKLKRKNPVYYARELQQKTGVQTIAARDQLTIDLYSYDALAEQKSLSKFTKEK